MKPGTLIRVPGFCCVSGEVVEEYGAARGTRTPDPRITNAMLYRLSYCGVRRRSKRAEMVSSP